MTFQGRTRSTRDDWQTPLWIVSALGEFDIDPCASPSAAQRCAKLGLFPPFDGLDAPWVGRAWVNPPYGSQAKKWLRRLAEHGNGIALVPPRMGAGWFQEIVLPTFDAMLFLRGRVDFIDPDTGDLASRTRNPETGKLLGGNNADSVLIAYGRENVAALVTCGLNGYLWVQRPAR